MNDVDQAHERSSERWSISIWLFVAAIGLLQISQVLQYPPGTDISPFAAQTSGLRPNTFAGQTVITWAFVFLAAVSLPGAMGRARKAIPGAISIWFALATVALVSVFTADSAKNLVDGVGKFAIPVIVYIFLSVKVRDSESDMGSRLVLWVNVFTIGQVVFAFFLTGSFGPNRYYRELGQEFFGLYYHPFAFVGVLGICTIVAFRHILGRRRVALNATLLVLNLSLILLSQVRTYIVATAFGLVIAVAILIIRRRQLLLAVIIMILLTMAIPFGTENLSFADDRVTGDFASGRFDRWQLDIETVWNQAGVFQLFFGGGPQYVFGLNELLFRRWINSLNLFVDLFVDFGIIGILLFLLIWSVIIRDAARLGDLLLVCSLVAFVAVASMISNVIEFPAVSVLFAVALTSCRDPISRESYAHPGASFTSVPRGSREQRVVGRGVH